MFEGYIFLGIQIPFRCTLRYYCSCGYLYNKEECTKLFGPELAHMFGKFVKPRKGGG